VFINEWMAANTNSLADPADGRYDDWFELFNPNDFTVDLGGYYLTDNLNNRFQYKIPDGYGVPGHGFLLVWADNQSSQNSSNVADLHVNFQLRAVGEEIGLFDPSGVLVDGITFTNQLDDISAGRYPDGSSTLYLMPGTATPRAANKIGGDGTHPLITPVAIVTGPNGQQVSFSFPTVPGKTYRVLWTANLAEPVNWQPLSQDIVGDGSNHNIVDSILPGTQRFYRIEVVN